MPSAASAVLVEAAMRINQHRRSRARYRTHGFGLFSSLFRTISCRRSLRKRGLRRSDVKVAAEKISRDFEVGVGSPRFCISPFIFPCSKSPSFSASSTPPFHLPLKPEEEDSRNGERGVEEEEDGKEQSSPVSTLEPPFDDDDPHICYENLQKYAEAKQQILYRISRFEKLAGVDPLELEKSLAEDNDFSDDDGGLGRHSLELYEALPKTQTLRGTNPSLGLCSDSGETFAASELENVGDVWGKYEDEVEEITGEIEIALCRLVVEELMMENVSPS